MTDPLTAQLAEQERRLEFTRFDNNDAWTIGSLLVGIAQERDLPVTIDVRRHGHLLFHAALPGTTPDNDAWIERKVRVVNRFNASSYLVGRRLAANDEALGPAQGVDEADYATHGGAFPIRITGVGVVGTITVSGLPQAEDHALVVEAIEAFLSGDRRTAAEKPGS